ncbi:AraC family transcriptional regulator [Larkinella arboricola]|uniref:AraC family transcriptional regulator n=1 Tax=Larkinella arboricola TaxID=643671 RepID=A0A327X9Y9_LARAB|nr:GyrI-like domain-containing protein [Larkinella arboricola]RAK02673.1 AraC family transcriptional regulator [Larkinella arboricola]
MTPRIETLPEKKLVGKRLRMSFANDRTGELWRSFMPRRKEIVNPVTTDLFSLQVYEKPFDYNTFTPTAEFEKWALVEVADFNHVPDGLETVILPDGLYAVFLYKGLPSEFAETFHYIFGTWLPASNYVLDHRPHFEVLGEKYRNNDPDSEEEIWVPIRTGGFAERRSPV